MQLCRTDNCDDDVVIRVRLKYERGSRSENRTYNSEVFNKIIEMLRDTEGVGYNELYRRVKIELGKLSLSTFAYQVKKMSEDGLLFKLVEERSDLKNKPTLYSLSTKAQLLDRLGILMADEKRERLRMMYQLILYFETHPPSKEIPSENVDKFLLDWDISKESLETRVDPENAIEIGFHPIVKHANSRDKNVQVIKTEIWERGRVRNVRYHFRLSGVSEKDLCTREHLELFPDQIFTEHEVHKAFEMLRIVGLIMPKWMFGNELRYSITDKVLRNMIRDAWDLHRLITNQITWKWKIVTKSRPEEAEWFEKIRGKKDARRIIITAHDYRKDIKNQTEYASIIDSERIISLERKEVLDEMIIQFRKKYQKTAEKYGFIKDFVDRICPRLM